MLERLADIIRPLLAENRQGFEANEAMMSIMGCGADELAEILTALGYRAQQIYAVPPDNAARATTAEPGDNAVAPEAAAESAAAKSDMAAAEATATQTQEEAALPFETQAVKTIWRPAPRGHHARKKPGGKKSTQTATRRKNGPQKQAKRPPRGKGEKTADPSSPFAVLKQLNTGAQNADEA